MDFRPILRSAAVRAMQSAGIAALAALSSVAWAGPAPDGQALVRAYCGGCHHPQDGQFDRISNIRKTPEGWVMTLFRMRQVHGLTLEPDVRDAIVRYLADTQGLAPAEARAGRFALERRPNAKDLDLGPELTVMCGRCHSLARVSLQRRDEEEWRKLANTHVGQWPSIEYSASGRDRPWFKLATVDLPPKLAAMYPFATDAWSAWRNHPPADLSGEWVVVGRASGGMDFYGTARIERDAGAATGGWRATYALRDTGGSASTGSSKAMVYTGYEWRGSAERGAGEIREVFAVSEDGTRIEGRWFESDHTEVGGEWLAVRDTGAPKIVAVLPRTLRAGSVGEAVIVGMNFIPGTTQSASLSFGDGVAASNVVFNPYAIRAHLAASPDALPGLRSVSVGGPGRSPLTGGTLAVYRQIDAIEVVPSYGIARIGGGRIEPVSAQFEALASTRLPGGEVLPLGPVAAQWTAVPYDAEAKRTEDEKFAGHFDQSGRFVPAGAGPNPAREYSGNNVGNLTVIAQAPDGTPAVEGKAHLIVTVQRWNTPPIY